MQTDEQLKAELIKTLGDRNWRLNNLYYIVGKDGKKIKYKFNRFQQLLFNELWNFNVILKSRQLGITTFFCILYLDAVLFKPNQTAGIIAHTKIDATKIFKRVKFAFDNLPKELKSQLEVVTDSTIELSFKNGSSIFVSVSTRSGTVQYLHISEFGPICKKYPEKAEEIVTGALNSVERGQMVSIESTAKGRQGKFFDICQEAQNSQRAGRKLNELDFKFFFFPWWQNPEYSLESQETIPAEIQAYFTDLWLKFGITTTESQRAWYYAKRKTQGESMMSEYPSTPEEAFQAANEGSYYGKQMAIAFQEKRVGFVPHDPKLLVETWWDLGRNDFNVILFTQRVGREIRFINAYYNRLEGLVHYANLLRKYRDELGYNYGVHYLPHDVEVTELSTNESRKSVLTNLRVMPIRVVPKLGIQEGIEMTRNIFNRFWFDEEKCAKLINALQNYQQEWDDKLGQAKDSPKHDDSSHFADAVRSVGVCFRDDIDQHEDSSFADEMQKHSLFPVY